MFQETLDPNFFLLNDFSAPSGKDRYPDIDGQIRLRDGNGNYLNLYLHYQLKSTTNLDNNKFRSTGDIFDYLLSTNIPTVLIVADVHNRKVHWFFINSTEKKKLALSEKNNAARTLDLSLNVIDPNNPLQLSQQWQEYAKEDDYTKLNDSVTKIASSFHQDIQKCLGLLYLLQPVLKKDLPDLFHTLLKVDKPEIDLIVQRLLQEGVVSKTANFYLLDNEQMGIESLHELLGYFNLSSLETIFDDRKDRKKILKQLARVDHELAQNHLVKTARDLLIFLEKPSNNDDIFANLDLLHEYAFRTPEETFKIINTIVRAKPLPPNLIEYRGLPSQPGYSHEDVLKKCIEILDDYRYIHRDIFDVLIFLTNTEEKSIKDEAVRVIEHLCKYNLFILKKFSYRVQEFILSEMEGWDGIKLAGTTEIVIRICTALMDPMFEGTSMQDYKTVTIHSGPLIPTKALKDIRRRTLKLLENLYSLAHDLPVKSNILKTLAAVTHTPHHGNYGEDMEQMVLDNTNELIAYYLSILPEAENDIVMDIEEQASWFLKRFGSDKAQRLAELKAVIASKTEYSMFRVFVGYDDRFDEDVDWNQAGTIRKEKIQEFVQNIDESNFLDWQRKISAVAKNYCVSDPGEFYYFTFFLFQLSKQKPELAFNLINKPELEPFLIHITRGLYVSSLRKQAEQIFVKWIKSGEHLDILGRLFEYVGFVDEKLLTKIFSKARKAGNIRALNNIICSIVSNYGKHQSLKDLFVRAIKELTKNQDWGWINNVWFRQNPILRDLSEADYHVILRNLENLPNIEYHAEEILRPIAEKYPEKVIDFFYKRVSIQCRKRENIADRYDAVPFEFHKIKEPLKEHESRVIPVLLNWYRSGNRKANWSFMWEASHLLQAIFPSFSPVLERSLIDLINDGRKDALEIVRSVLSRNEGEIFLFGVVKAVVMKYAVSKRYNDIKNSLFGYLSQTGVVSGEYGFVVALENKKHELEPLKADSDKRFVQFIQSYGEFLEKRIEYERKRADEDIEMRKRQLEG